MKIDPSPKIDFDSVLIKPIPSELTSRSEVDTEVNYITKHSKVLFSGTPICVANMSTVGTIDMAKSLYKHKIWTALHKFYNDKEDIVDFINKDEKSKYSFVSVGESERDLKRLINIQKRIDASISICFDVANLYRYSALDSLKRIRDQFPKSIIMAGNVATPEGVENCIKAGADIVKVGIGPGSFCETRKKTGIGYGQLSACIECAQVANEENAIICCDGGMKSPGDICKALVAGSHMVMTSYLFSGTDECEGEFRVRADGLKEFFMYGMSSKYANEKFAGGLKSYRTSEGKEGWIPTKGAASSVAQDIIGGLASCCTYTNCKRIENLSKNTQFTIIK